MHICTIPAPRELCEERRIKCSECSYHYSCDYFWIEQLWTAENKKFGKNSLLGPCISTFVKPDLRANHIISVTGKLDFCCFNVPKTKDYVVIGDIYVDESLRGQGISKKLINYLMETYDRDIFAKCVRDTSAEMFWKHIGEQLDANAGSGPDFYEHREGKRDLGWYKVENKNKKFRKIELF